MPDVLLNTDELHQSPVVANCRMNRERNLGGSNGYSRDLNFDVLEFLKARCERLSSDTPVRWLDLCCGTGRALNQTAMSLRVVGLAEKVSITGVDLVDMFDPHEHPTEVLHLIASPVEAALDALDDAAGPGLFDLITCVHGLHYVGDKLGVVTSAISKLTADGTFLAHLDLANLRWEDRQDNRRFARIIRQSGIGFDGRRKLLHRVGRHAAELPVRYQGADDAAGPNYTGQPAVNSHYGPRPSRS